ncbi:MAG: A24 family peptidase [Syntrophobacteraceae bacterium]
MFGLSYFTVMQAWMFIIGCCLGSFYNVVIHRLPNGESLVHPPSHCPGCDKPIAPYDNIPILSYLLLRGKCRHCRASISPRYPLVEALTGLVAMLLFRRYGFHPQLLVEFVFASILIIITFIDLDTYTIPDVFSLTGIGLGFLGSFLTARLSWTDSLLGVLLGGGLFWAIAAGYAWVRRREGLGGGDIKLLAMIGAFVGWSGVVFTILAASISGLAVGLVVMARSRQGLTAMIPFGPFLALGAISYIFWGQSFFQWYMGTM